MKKIFGAGEVANMLGITKEKLREFRYKEMFSLEIPVEEGEKNQYTEKDIETLKKLTILNKATLSCDNIRKIQDPDNKCTLQEALNKRKVAVEKKIKEMSNSLLISEELIKDGVQYDTIPIDYYWKKIQDKEEEGKMFMDAIEDEREAKKREVRTYIDCDTGYNIFVKKIGIAGDFTVLPIEVRISRLDELFKYAKKIHEYLKALKEDALYEKNIKLTPQEITAGIDKLFKFTISYVGGTAGNLVSSTYIKFQMINIDTLMSMNFSYSEEGSPIQDILESILCSTIYVLRHLWSIDMDLPWNTDVEEYAKQYGADKADELIMMVTNLYEKYQIQEMYPYFNNNPELIFGLLGIIEEGIENQLLGEETGMSILSEIIRLSESSEATDLYMNRERIERWVCMIDEGEGEELLEELEYVDPDGFYGDEEEDFDNYDDEDKQEEL